MVFKMCTVPLIWFYSLAGGKNVLVEGANAAMLDIDFGEFKSRLQTDFILINCPSTFILFTMTSLKV